MRWPRFGLGRARRSKLLLASTLASVAIGGCSENHDSPRPASTRLVPTASVEQQRQASVAASALREHGALVEGYLPSVVVAAGVECDALVGRAELIDCWFGQGVDGEDPVEFRVRVQADGTLSKVLGAAAPVSGAKSSADTARLLAADDRFQHAPSRSRSYECRRSPRLEPDGTRGASGAAGQICSTYLRVSRRAVRRYVEFVSDGTVIRDYTVSGT